MKKVDKLDILIFCILTIGYLYLCFSGFISCTLYNLTGFKCAGCGGCHMFIALLKGDFQSAFEYNAFVFITAIPLALSLLLLKSYRKRILIVYGIALVAWSILRNFGGI